MKQSTFLEPSLIHYKIRFVVKIQDTANIFSLMTMILLETENR